tara:strand:+ start:1492 stop:2076 length:585 start_codon:yes stop_codon:yes gene_type:complete
MSKKTNLPKKGDCLYCHTTVPEEHIKCNTCQFPHRGTVKNKIRFSKQIKAKQGDYTMYSSCKGITGIGFLLYSIYYLNVVGGLYYENDTINDVFLLSVISLLFASIFLFIYQKAGAIIILISFLLHLFLGVMIFGSEFLQYDTATRGILMFTLAITLFRVNHHLELRKYLKVIKKKGSKSTAIEAYSRAFSSFL